MNNNTKDKENFHSLLEAVVDQCPAGVIIASAPSGKIIYVSSDLREVFKQFNYKAENIKDYDFWRGFRYNNGLIYKPEDWPLSRSLRGEFVENEEVHVFRSDQTCADIRVTSSPIRDINGQIIAAVAIIENITEIKKSTGDLEKREKAFETLANNIPDIVARFDRHLRYLFVNPASIKASGLTPDQMIGKTNEELGMLPDSVKFWNQKITNVFNTGKFDEMEFTYPSPRGETICYQSRLVPEFNEEREVISVLAVTRDITDIKLADKRKDEFISMTSHELKTPITSAKIFTQILKRNFSKSPDKTSYHYIRRLEEQINRLIKVINDLLDFSHIEYGKITLNIKKVSLNKMIKEVVEAVQAVTLSHKISVEESRNLKVLADKNLISQVLTNLLNNAIKYSPQADKVIISVEVQDNKAIVKVKDFGSGISKKHIKNVFDKFFRIKKNNPHRSNIKGDTGLGLGLYIAAQIIKQHNEKIYVESKINKGSTFSFTLAIA